MKVVEIDSVNKKQIVPGVTCPKCGGDLVALSLPDSRARIIRAATLGLVVMQTLVCATCNKKFNLF